MAEIRRPDKQSVINKPIGIARASTGSAEAANRIASASANYANSIVSTVSTALDVGARVQQTYEQKKYTDLAQSTPVLDENGKYVPLKVPAGLSMRNKDAVNEILSKRYLTHARSQLVTDLVTERSKTKDPDIFNKAASTLLSTRVEEMRVAGGDNIAAQLNDVGTLLIAEHYADAKTKRAALFDEATSNAYDIQLNSDINKLALQARNGAPFEAIALGIANITSQLTPSADGEEINAATANGMTSRRQRELINIAQQKIATALIVGRLRDSNSEEINNVSIALQTGVADESTLAAIPDFYNIYEQLLSDPSNIDYVTRQVSGLKGDVQNQETYQAKQNSYANDFSTGAGGQKRVSANLSNNMGINSAADLMAAVADPNKRDEVINHLSDEVALPHHFVNALNAIATGQNLADPARVANMAQLAKELIRNQNGTLISGGKGLDVKTIAFIDALTSFREWAGDANLPTWIEKARTAGLDTPENRQVIGKELEVENYQNQSSKEMSSNWLHNNTDFNANFIEENSSLFSYLLTVTGSSGKAEESLQELYDLQHATYKYDYKSPIGDGKQRYGVGYYFDRGQVEFKITDWSMDSQFVSSEEKNKSSGLYKFEQTAKSLVQSNPDYSVYEIGTDYLFKADPRNNAENGKFYITDRLGNFLFGSDAKPLVIHTSGIDAQTILERRRIVLKREQDAIQAAELRKARRIMEQGADYSVEDSRFMSIK